MKIPLFSMLCFREVAIQKNFTRAAQQLRIGQSAISQQIKNMEVQLQSTLFIRNKKEILLTKEGKLLLEELSPILDSLENCFDKHKERQESLEGSFRIGTFREFGELFISTFLKEMKKEYPLINFHFLFGSNNELEEELKKGNIDFSLSLGVAVNENIRSYLLLRQKAFVITQSKSKTLDELIKDGKWNLYRLGDPLVSLYFKHKKRTRAMSQIQVNITANSHQLLLEQTIQNKDNISILPEFSKEVQAHLTNKPKDYFECFDSQTYLYLHRLEKPVTSKISLIIEKELKDFISQKRFIHI